MSYSFFPLLIVFLSPAGLLCAASVQDIIAMPIATFAQRQAKVKAADTMLQSGTVTVDNVQLLQGIKNDYAAISDLDRRVNKDLLGSEINTTKEIRLKGYEKQIQQYAANQFYEPIKANIQSLRNTLSRGQLSLTSIADAEKKMISILKSSLYKYEIVDEIDPTTQKPVIDPKTQEPKKYKLSLIPKLTLEAVQTFIGTLAIGFDQGKPKRDRLPVLRASIERLQRQQRALQSAGGAVQDPGIPAIVNEHLTELIEFLQKELKKTEQLSDDPAMSPTETRVDIGVSIDFDKRQKEIEKVLTQKYGKPVEKPPVVTGGQSGAFKKAQETLAAERGATVVTPKPTAGRTVEPLQALLLLHSRLTMIAARD